MPSVLSFISKVQIDLGTFLIFIISALTFFLGAITICLLPFVVEFKVFSCLILGCSTGTGVAVLIGSFNNRVHLLTFSVPFLIVEEVLLALVVMLLVDLQKQQSFLVSVTWYIAVVSALLQIACQLLFVASAIYRRRKIKTSLTDEEDQLSNSSY